MSPRPGGVRHRGVLAGQGRRHPHGPARRQGGGEGEQLTLTPSPGRHKEGVKSSSLGVKALLELARTSYSDLVPALMN